MSTIIHDRLKSPPETDKDMPSQIGIEAARSMIIRGLNSDLAIRNQPRGAVGKIPEYVSPELDKLCIFLETGNPDEMKSTLARTLEVRWLAHTMVHEGEDNPSELSPLFPICDEDMKDPVVVQLVSLFGSQRFGSVHSLHLRGLPQVDLSISKLPDNPAQSDRVVLCAMVAAIRAVERGVASEQSSAARALGYNSLVSA